MSEETDTPSARPRTSRFKEHTNTTNSIKPPPDELWKDLAIDELIDGFNEENNAPPATARKVSSNSTSSSGRPGLLRGSSNTSSTSAPSATGSKNASATQTAAPVSEGAFGRFRSAFASVFGGVLGKRKAGHADAERGKEQQLLDERKKAAEAAYHEAKDLGLLPTPKVFVRPGMKPHVCAAETPVNRQTPRTPSTATIRHTPSKKDLRQQKKLSKRVSDLEHKLASARKELQNVLHNNEDMPPVPPLPIVLPPTPPVTSQSDSADIISVETTTTTTQVTTTVDPAPQSSPVGPRSSRSSHDLPRKITKKRKATSPTDSDADYRPIPTDSEGDIDMLSMSDNALSERELEKRTVKRVKSNASRKSSRKEKSENGKLQKKSSRKSLGGSSSRRRSGSREREREREEKEVRLVPDGVDVPFLPTLPDEVVVKRGKGHKGKDGEDERDDGYGGLEHEMF